MDYIKIRKLFSSKGIFKGVKRKITDYEKILQLTHLTKDSHSAYKKCF